MPEYRHRPRRPTSPPTLPETSWLTAEHGNACLVEALQPPSALDVDAARRRLVEGALALGAGAFVPVRR